MAAISLRPAGFDDLGLRRALSDRMLPLLVAAMAFLAALALAGWIGAASLAAQWRDGAGAALTVQVPRPHAPASQPGASRGAPSQGGASQGGTSRLVSVMSLLSGTPGVASVRALPDDELADLLRPWLGTGAERLAVPLPAVVAVRLAGRLDVAPLAQRLQAISPGALLEDHGVWLRRLSALAWSLQTCSGLALVLVATVAAAVIAVATRAGLSSRREAIEIVHGLGATDSYIAGRFARRATMLATVGGLVGAILAMPVLLALAQLAAPFSGASSDPENVSEVIALLPPGLWLILPGLPLAAAAIGFLTAHGTVRRWLRRLP